ncbi:hypothetical protein VNI00_004409 [Paramarasmius palmivorus]|uniref:Isopenicillin N synthase-like Fe(2+) 2OG dioxygenase domain-containing protein n=1 Tax=Paramarasmius palmivorus TaxID=297713 RepID=A0AAW0DP43_9AGAR
MSESLPEILHYIPAQPTKESLDYADLPVIDLAKAKGSQDDLLKLADETERIFDIANIPFTRVPEEEKLLYDAKSHESGSFQGYKLREYWIPSTLREASEIRSSRTTACYHMFNSESQTHVELLLVNRNVTRRAHPEAIRPLIPEIDAFARHNHFNVALPILRLLAIGLELPENTFADMHDFSATGESFGPLISLTFSHIVRLTTAISPVHEIVRLPTLFSGVLLVLIVPFSYPRLEEDEIKSKNVWFKGHTDFGSITLLYSQPVAALQILGLDGKWRWVKHIENAIIVNAGDAMESFSGGYYKATIHRVFQPPADQRGVTRLGAYYFNIPDDHVKLVPRTDSPLLQRLGIQRRFESDDKTPTMEEWRKSRTLAYGQNKGNLKVGEQQGEAKVDEEIINGIVVKHYK